MTVQLSLVPVVPVQEAGKVLAPCLRLTVVEQLAGLELQGKLEPVIAKAKLDMLLVDWLASLGVSVWTRGKVEDVLNISLTFCR